ncbi:MAG: PepSY-associated TM helix domain-containing protein [Planctomycetota bacterium]
MRSAAWIARWGHTFVSSFGFGALVFFSVTGITLNHPDVFETAEPVELEFSGSLEPSLLAVSDGGVEVQRLEIVEELRAEHGLRGRVTEFRIDDDEVSVVFAAPGYSADAWIDRTSGSFEGVTVTQGTWVLLNDLHKGRDSGAAWRWLIDVSAAILIVAGLSGIWLLWYVRKRRTNGLLVTVLGAALLPLVYVLYEL